MSAAVDPDGRQPHYPAGSCACGADLGQATDLGVERSQQVHDVPTITVRVAGHDLHRVGCGCGRQYVAPGPGSGPVSYRPNLQAFAVYLLVYQHVPVARCAQLIADLTGATPSTGFIHGMLARAAGTVAGVVATIKTLITRAPRARLVVPSSWQSGGPLTLANDI
jgi:transposase